MDTIDISSSDDSDLREVDAYGSESPMNETATSSSYRALPSWSLPTSSSAGASSSSSRMPHFGRSSTANGRSLNVPLVLARQQMHASSSSNGGPSHSLSRGGQPSVYVIEDNDDIDHERRASKRAKRTLPSSLQPVFPSNRSNDFVENIGGSVFRDRRRTPYQSTRAFSTNDDSYRKDQFGITSQIMHEKRGNRVLSQTLVSGRSSISNANCNSSEPSQNRGTGEERPGTNERLVFQAALQDINQPKTEANLPEGLLSVPLLRHQKIALAWMIKRETVGRNCLGGILADDQGLGKTISMIAIIQMHRSLQEESKSENLRSSKVEAFNLDDDDDDKNMINAPDKHKIEVVDDDDKNMIDPPDKQKIEVVDDEKDEVDASDKQKQKVEVADDDKDEIDASDKQKLEVVDDDKDDIDASDKQKVEVVDDDKDEIDASDKHKQKVEVVSEERRSLPHRKPAAGTLVVCPASVVRQWNRELEEKVTEEAKLSVLIYHGGNRTKDAVELAKYDVVLTTYAIVKNEAPKQPSVDEEENEQNNGLSSEFAFGRKRKKGQVSKKEKKRKNGLEDGVPDPNCGTIAKVRWFRVILDEAQTIKNHRTQVARACCRLRAKRRWCLSGTPIQNAIEELFSYFRFLKFEPYCKYTYFYQGIKLPISRDSVKGYAKLQLILRSFMLRRTKETVIDGQPIISLPPKDIQLTKIEFSPEERSYYTNLESETRKQFKAYAAAGTVNQNYANILLMLLRLRQACDHPLLVEGVCSKFTVRSSLGIPKNLPTEKLGSSLNLLEASSAICCVCNDPPEDAVVSVCEHVFCFQCVSDYLTGEDNTCPAFQCKKQLNSDVLFSANSLRKSLYGDENGDGSSYSGFYEKSSLLQNDYSSSKIKAALELLQECLTSNPGSEINASEYQSSGSLVSKPIKAIVFSQWTGMLNLIEVSMRNTGLIYRRLDGGMSLAARDKAVKEFNTNPEVTVMLMSLKAGNLGLNMVAACRVIMLDLWWNPTTEDQAIDRAHRIGQTRPVVVSRLTIQNSVEDRILALQAEKRKMVASAFGEDKSGGTATRLTMEDLKYLFGV